MISIEPEFRDQKAWLIEEVKKVENCHSVYNQKYHCELKYIEMIWG